MATRTRLQAVLQISMLSVALLTGCSDDDTEEGRLVVGNVKSVITDAVQAQRNFIVKDLEQPLTADPVATGTSDSNGNYSFHIQDVIYMVVIFGATTADPQVTGLVSVAEGDANKPLDNVTDLACRAGVRAVVEEAVDPTEMNRTRIQNLELAAAQVIEEDDPDFNDSTELDAAIERVRDLTDDGDHPPA